MRTLYAAITAALMACAAAASGTGLEVLDCYFRPDVPFVQFEPFWSDSSAAEGTSRQRPTGGTVHLFVVNRGSQAVRLNDDVVFNGVSLAEAIAPSSQRKFKGVYPTSIHFADLSEDQRSQLIAAGEPVYYKIDPRLVAPGHGAQVTVRLRRTPAIPVKLRLQGLNTDAVESTPSLDSDRPSIRSISFTDGRARVLLYSCDRARRKPVAVFVDDRDVTSECAVVFDPACDAAIVEWTSAKPLAEGSFAVYEVRYADGARATAGIRAYDEKDLCYGMWGARPGAEDDLAAGKAHVLDMATHNINVQQTIIGSDAVRAFMESADGRKLMAELGIRRIIGEVEKSKTPEEQYAYYLADEPDAAEHRVTGVPGNSKVGTLGLGMLDIADTYRAHDPLTPNMLNVDMTFKPDNWYTYGQLPDIFAADPYYQTRLAQAYFSKPETIPLYKKATFVYAVSALCESACAPNPLHIMLNSVCTVKDGKRFRFGTPEEKRIELYYAIAAGAKSFSYWWFVPLRNAKSGSDGLGSDDPAASKLWHEIGLLGAEARTAGPLILRSCPIELPVTGPPTLWVRSLASGRDTILLLCVNDDYTNNRDGTTIVPVSQARVTTALPSWLKPTDAFAVDSTGTRDVSWKLDGQSAQFELGTIEVTRMVIVTSDAGLRARLQKLYKDKFAANVAKLNAGGDS